MRAKGFRRRLLAGALVFGLVSAAADVAAATPNTQGAAHVAKIGQYGVGQTQKTFMRPTGPTTSRTLDTRIYYPMVPPGTSVHRFPLILFSHGLGAHPMFYENLLEAWASAGYVVAAPVYPLSNYYVAGTTQGSPSRIAGFNDVKNQVRDAKYVIGKVIQEDATNQLVGGTINDNRVGVAGHSLGGITTYGLVYSNCCHADGRIKAAIPMSACAGVVDNPNRYFGGAPTPLLIPHSSADAEIGYQFATQAFATAKSPKALLRFDLTDQDGTGHNIPFTGNVPSGSPQSTTDKVEALKHATVDWWDRYLEHDTSALSRLTKDAAIQDVHLIQGNVPRPPLLKCESYVHP